MKKAKKLTALMLLAAFVLAFIVPVTAMADTTKTGTITITNTTADNVYKVYKVFDANGDGTHIVYNLVNGKTNAPAGFTVDGNGYVTYTGDSTDKTKLAADDIAAIAEYVKNDKPIKVVTATGNSVAVDGLAPGYYYITTTTGTAVSVTSTNPNATVKDKNDAPVLDKKITGVTDGSFDKDGKKALAQVGTTVSYTATIEVKTGAVGYVFHDTMESSLQYDATSLKVQVDDIDVAISNYSTVTAQGDTITLTFDDEWIKTQVGKTITITYNATITSDALTTDSATNTAKLNYGHNGHINTTPEKTTDTYNAKFTVTKTDKENQPLAGAGFVIAKTVGEGPNAETLYYKKENEKVSWVENSTGATELKTTDATGGNVLIFTGLADGTYTLVEKTVPDGYNKADDYTFTIKQGDYGQTNLEQSITVVNQSGAELPSTGGMGTTIFYVLGAVLVVGAGVLLVTKKRMSNQR